MRQRPTQEQLEVMLDKHKKWLNKKKGGKRFVAGNWNWQGLDFRETNLRKADLSKGQFYFSDFSNATLQDIYAPGVVFFGASLRNANLHGADLQKARFDRAFLIGADLNDANLSGTLITHTIAQWANFKRANLQNTILRGSILSGSDFFNADLTGADFTKTQLVDARFSQATLHNVKGLTKIMGVEPGNIYWKRFDRGLKNRGFQYKIGLNKLPKDQIFVDDPRELCSYPGLHFGSRSWCETFMQCYPYEAKIRIPEEAKINEPWATDGKASADMIEVLQVFDARTGKDITDKFR